MNAGSPIGPPRTFDVTRIDRLGSPGEMGGVKQGDVIVAMNGKPVAELDQEARIAALRASPLRLDVLTGDRAWVCNLTLE